MINLYGQEITKLEKLLMDRGQKKYRATQLFTWIYEKKAKTFDEMSDWLRNKADELECVEKSKLKCLYRNARRRLKKELYNYVKRNAECMGWSIGDFIGQCLLAVTNYEVSIDEVMERELMFAV